MLVAKSKGDTKTKTQLLKRIVEIDPKNSDAYVEMANDQMFRKKYKLAGNYYLKAAECDPYNTTALIGYGQCAYYQGKFKEAKIALNKALSIQPKNSMAWSYLAKLDAEDENYAAATENIQKAIEYDGFYQDYWIDYGRYMYYQGKFKAAENCWNKAASLDDTNFLVYVYRSSLYDEQGRYQQAIQDYKHIVSIKPEYYYAYEALGILYWHENNWAESRNNFLKAHEYAKDNISYSLMVSACLIKEKQIEANKKFLSNVLKNRDQNSTEYNILRLYYDGMNPQIASTKVQNETNSTLRGKCLFYLGLFYDLYGDDLNAKNYYNAVTNMQAPMFFEYRIAEWSLGSKK